MRDQLQEEILETILAEVHHGRRVDECFQCNKITELVFNGLCRSCSRKSAKKWREDNPNKFKEYVKKWQRANPGKMRAYQNKRRADRLKQTPSWANLEAIKQIYINCPKGLHVDHIIPLRGKSVSGFHAEYNLQYLTPSENCKKSNKFT